MINQTIRDISSKIEKTASLDAGQKKELLQLLDGLKKEVVQLSKTHQEDAESVARFVDLTAGEGLKKNRNPELMRLSVQGFRVSVKSFEVSHPNLTSIVNGICNLFSNMGI